MVWAWIVIFMSLVTSEEFNTPLLLMLAYKIFSLWLTEIVTICLLPSLKLLITNYNGVF